MSRRQGQWDVDLVRILVVTNLYPPIAEGGYELCCGLVVARLRQRHDVRVLTSDQRASEAPPDRWVQRTLPLFSGVSGDTLTAPLVTRKAIREVRATLEEFAPELIFIWAGSVIPKGAIRVLETSGVPLAFSIHDYWFDRPYDTDPFTRYLSRGQRGIRGLWGCVVRLCNRLPSLRVELDSAHDAAVCWNSETTRRLTQVSPTIRPVLTETIYPASIHEGVLSTLHREPSGRTTIVFVGRVTPEKGPDVAIRALGMLSTEYGIDAELVMCGTTSADVGTRLRELARAVGVDHRVRMLGPLAIDTLADVLAGGNVLIVPSVWQEPLGLVCLEGALARIPVVASRIGGMTEVLHDEEHALFFAPGDARAAADAIARVLSAPDETAARVERAYARAGEFSTERYVLESERFVDRTCQVLHVGHGDDREPSELGQAEVR